MVSRRRKAQRKQLRFQRSRQERAYRSKSAWDGSNTFSDGTVPAIAWCQPCQKQAVTRRAAKLMIRVLNEPGMRRYPCPVFAHLGWWHAGHIPEVVRKGHMSADEVYGGRKDGQDG